MNPLVQERVVSELEYSEDAGRFEEMRWFEEIYVCPEHGASICSYPPPCGTEEFCEQCADALLADRPHHLADREPHEEREFRYRENTMTGRPEA